MVDTNIKHSAFRQYCYLLSKPTGWQVRNKDISNQIGIESRTIASNFKNLINAGFITRRPIKNVQGKFIGGYNYQIFVIPTDTTKNANTVNCQIRQNTINGKTADYNNTYNTEPSNLDYLKILHEVDKEKRKSKNKRSYTQKPRTKNKLTVHDTVRPLLEDQNNTSTHSTHNFVPKFVQNSNEIEF
ncbi:MAG: helix-turn-helix domain-containing protein [Halarcobacter sp.]